MKTDRMLSLLGMALRARKVIIGENVVLPQISSNPGAIIFLASDAGDNLRKKVYDKARSYRCTVIDRYDTTQLSHAMGKNNRKIALCIDEGFNKLFNAMM